MASAKIITGSENKILRTRSAKTTITKSKKIIEKLKKAVELQPALGIAAPQIGENVRVVLVKVGQTFVAMINPEILQFSKDTIIGEEGCLSLPNIWGQVERCAEVVVEFLDEKGNKKKMHLKELDSRVVQHEVDHLEGILFTDKAIGETVFESRERKTVKEV